VWGSIKAPQMAWIMQAATEERMEVPESFVRTLNICHCGDYHEEALGFLQPQPKHIPLYTKYQQLLASE
jgi:hypothetical protein